MVEFYVYPLLALLFVALFCREVIAPASRKVAADMALLRSCRQDANGSKCRTRASSRDGSGSSGVIR